ncbi:MAG: fatty acid desaturase [bacterium]|nr:fatty acid desaturase [bacterium]
MLRYRVDAISVAAVLAAVGVQLTAFFAQWPWYGLIPIVFLLRWSHLVQHNHAHLGAFRSKTLNEILGWLMFLNDGLPLEFYRIQHVQIHHKYLNDEGDWTSPFAFHGARFPDKPVHPVYYVLSYPVFSYALSLVHVLRRPQSAAFRRFFVSLAIVGTTCVVLCVLDPRSFILFFGLAWLCNSIGASFNNWMHHVGCEYEDIYTSSNVNLSFLSRWFGFNIGYHSAHHLEPRLHWSKLAELHSSKLQEKTPSRYYRNGPRGQAATLSAATAEIGRPRQT